MISSTQLAIAEASELRGYAGQRIRRSHADESRAAVVTMLDLTATGPVLLDMTPAVAEEADGCWTVDARILAVMHSKRNLSTHMKLLSINSCSCRKNKGAYVLMKSGNWFIDAPRCPEDQFTRGLHVPKPPISWRQLPQGRSFQLCMIEKGLPIRPHQSNTPQSQISLV